MTRASTTQKGPPKKRKPQARKIWRKRFLAKLRNCGIVRLACAAARVDRTAAYRARQNDAKFAAAWDDAMEDACDLLEEEAQRRAVEGVVRRVYWQGKSIDTFREYSDGLLIKLLAAHRPSLFRQNYRIEHTGKDGGPIQERDVTGLSDAELEAIAAGGKPKGKPR